MYYFICVEFFIFLYVQLQSGCFDCFDWQFYLVVVVWQVCLESFVDVKEFILEFFYFFDFLENQNGFDLGCFQLINEKVGDVVLFLWVSFFEDFIQQYCQVLELEYVFVYLYEWIDFIFGYKQWGLVVEEVFNVFYYCIYEGVVDLDYVIDEWEWKVLEGIISNFGQIFCQLLKELYLIWLLVEEVVYCFVCLDINLFSIFQYLD